MLEVSFTWVFKLLCAQCVITNENVTEQLWQEQLHVYVIANKGSVVGIAGDGVREQA